MTKIRAFAGSIRDEGDPRDKRDKKKSILELSSPLRPLGPLRPLCLWARTLARVLVLFSLRFCFKDENDKIKREQSIF
jgi:hypothetical protein